MEVPPRVLAALGRLVGAGYCTYLIKNPLPVLSDAK